MLDNFKNDSDNRKNALDMFGLTDMDKIQEEIEQALDGVAPMSEPSIVQQMQPGLSPLLQPTASPLTQMSLVPATSNFYRETIKYVPQEKSSLGSWLKKAVAFFLIFTLGTGSLGLGIGAGFARFRPQHITVYNNPADASENMTLTSINPSFVDIGETGTIADIVEALEPSVVAVIGYPVENFPASSGSGVIFAEDELRIFIVTSHLIVRGRTRVSVSVAGSGPIDAFPVGDDSTVYLSVIAVYKHQLVAAGVDTITIATFGDSDQMRVGDVVLAIGNAMGDGNSVTRGVISAKERTTTLTRGGHIVSLLQTDAAMNYGNSGGPLINTRGEVIGINLNEASSLIFNMSSIEGIGYSLPSSIIAPLLDDIIHSRRPALGVTVRDVSPEVAAQHRILQLGAYIYTVTEGGAAYRGGMLPSDIVTSFNGYTIMNRQQLIYAIRTAEVGDTVEVRVLRNGDTALTLYIQLDAMVFDRF